MVATVALLTAVISTINPAAATAAGTVLFQNTFTNRTVDGTGSVTVPTPTSGTNAACLTASGNSATLPLLSCPAATDPQGSGKLRMTNSSGNEIGGVFGETSFPTSNGLDVTFNSYQWGGGGADGMAFMLAAVNPANPVAPTLIGPGGGSLGYSPAGSINGLPNAYLGVGLDVFGNFSNPGFQGTGCTNAPNITAATPGAVVVRGPGNNRAGYCGLTTTYTGTPASKVVLRANTRSASVVPVQVLINPTSSAFTSATGVSVDPGTYKVVVTPVGQSPRTIVGPLPTVAAGVYPSSSWTTAAGVPRQLAFAFVGSTGSVTDAHEASDVKVLTFNPVPQLTVASTSYTAPSPAPGAPVTYRIATSVQAGANETSPISMTQTTPAGVVPVGAYGTGWACAAPIGQTVTCTTTGSSFANGTALPVITVVGIVTSASMTAATVQNASVARVSSVDANPDTDSVTTAGALPTAPSAVVATPSIGDVAGGGSVVVRGSNLASATAIEIGTAAEQVAATPVTLLPCAGNVAAPGCFTESSGTLTISAMPARSSAATVTVTVVTAGLASAGNYVYASAPAPPAAPTATAGITSATATWVAPATNGSAITSYTVTPFLGTTAGTPVNVGPTVLSRTFTGLTVGGSYTFAVTATNAYGTSAASAKSAAVVPYTLPGAPTITAATAGDSSAVLTWTTPANGSSTITGYLVTPYVAGVAQATQAFSGSGTTRTVTGLAPGTGYTFAVAAQNAAGTGPLSARSGAVVPNFSPSLVFPAPPAGEVGVAYSVQLAATNGTSPFTWAVSAGALPPGLNLSSAGGLLSGTPTAAGSYPFTVQIVDASGQTASKAVTLVIAAAPSLTFAPDPGEVAVAYSQQPTVSGGTAPFTWAVTAGSLPAGVSINSATGLISGTPTAAGTFSVTVAVTDSFGQVASKTVSVVIVAQPTLTFSTPSAAQVGVSYTTAFDVTGGTLPLTWSISAGTLPPGLALDASTGILSGMPTTAGNSPVTVSVVDARGQTANRSITLVVGAGPIVVTKTASTSSAVAGGVVSYTITVTNTGNAAFAGVTISDPLSAVLDDAVYGADVTATSGTVGYTNSTIGWSGSIAAAQVVTITYSVTVANPDVGNKVLSNTVSSSTLGTNCSAGSTDARCSTIVTVPGLTIVKTADVATTVPGGTVNYRIVVTNTGQTAYPVAAFSDSLGGVLDDAAYNLDGSATTGSLAYSAPTLTWSGPLPVGASATITYSVTVANTDAGDRLLTNSVVSSSPGSPCPAVDPAASCTATVSVLVPALSIATTATPDATTTPGSTVAYSSTIANTGQTAYPATTSVTLALAGALDDATLNDDAAVTGGGSVVYDAVGGTLTWTGTLALGATVTVTSSMTVHSPVTGDKLMTTSTTSTAAGSTCAPGGSRAACATTVQVRVPGLTMTTSADAATTTPGDVVNYTVSAINTGQTPYAGVVLKNELLGLIDDATYAGDAAASSGALSYAGSTLTWSGDLVVGGTVTITYSATVHDPDTGDLLLSTGLTSTAVGANCPAGGTDARCATAVEVLVPGLSFSTSFDATTTTPGSVVRYEATVTNSGQTAYTGLPVTLDLAAALDDAGYNHDAAATAGGLIVNADGSVSWTVDLAPGDSASVSLSLSVTDPDAGDRLASIRISSEAAGTVCPALSAQPECVASVSVLVPGLTISKTADSSTTSPGGTVGYTIQIANTGETPYASITVADQLASVLTDATFDFDGATATTGALDYTSTVLSWTGSLSPGSTATISYSVIVLDPSPGDKRMINTVTSAAAGSNCAAGSTDPRCTSAVDILVPSLTVATSSDAVTTIPGASVGYTLTITNSGPTSYGAAAVSQSLAGVLDDASYAGDAAADSGTVAWTGSAVTWSGPLAPGATATITYSVLVHAQPGGDNLLTSTTTSTSSGNTCPPDGTDTRCTTVVPVARLLLSQQYSEATTTPGSLVTLTATFSNTGQVPYTGITVSSPSAGTVDDAIPTGDQSATSGTLVLTGTAITWTGSIPVGGVVTVTGTLRITDPDLGDRDVTGTLQSAAPGSNCPVGGADSRCTAHVAVLQPGLTVTTTASAAATVPGGTVGYTLTLNNTGQTPYAAAAVSVTLLGVLDDAVYNGDAVATSGSVAYSAPALSWTGALAVGATVVVSYSVTVRIDETGDKTMVTSASSQSVGNTCPPASGNAACHTTVVVLTPALTILKTANRQNATLGTTVTYTVVVTNSGQTSYTGAAFTDSLADVLDDASFVAGSLTAASGTPGYSAGVVSWSGNLGPTASATITYAVTINNPVSGDGNLANTVVSGTRGSNCAASSDDTRCTAVVTVTDSVSLTFTKTADVVSTVAGAVVHYTVSAANSSTEDLEAEFTDPLSGILDNASYGGDAVATGGSVTFDDPALSWSGTIAAGSTVTVTYSVTVDATVADDQSLDGTLVSGSLPASNNCLVASADPRCISSVPIASLVIQQHYTETSTTAGSVVHLSATFTNTGALPYTGITVSSPSAGVIDDAIPDGNQVASSGTIVLTSSAIIWTGNIPVGGTVTVSGTLTVKNPDPGNRLLSGTLVSNAPGSNCPTGGTDGRCTALLPVLLPALTITKTANVTFVVPGGTALYTVTVHNTGETAYDDAVVTDALTGILDDAVYNADVTATVGTVSYDSPTLTWQGDLPAGATSVITYSVTARNPSSGDKTMINPVTSTEVGSTCPPASGNAACRSTIVVLTPGVTITSAADVATSLPGATVSYTVVATNTGQVPYSSAGLSIALDGILDDATYSGGVTATSGAASVVGSQLTWSGPLGTGASATIRYSVQVDLAPLDAEPAGDFRLEQTVVSSSAGTTCPAAGTDTRCTTSVPIASLLIINEADVATTQPTGIVHYTGTFTNRGQVPYLGVSVSDGFAGAQDDASYNGDATADSGSMLLVAGSGKLVWSGDVAVGQTVVISGSVTVNNPPTGDHAVTTLLTTDAPATNCPVGGSDPRCATSTTVLLPRLTITTSTDVGTATPGSLVNYTTTATNTGQTDYLDASISDALGGVLSDGSYDGEGTATRGTVSFTDPTLTWSGDLLVGQSVVISYAIRVDDPDLGDRSLVNAVSSAELGSTCPPGGAAPACSATVFVLVPALDLAIAADMSTTLPGGTVGYTVTIHNSGQTDYAPATATVNLLGALDDTQNPAAVNATMGDVVFSASALQWTGPLAVGETAVVTFALTVHSPDEGNRVLSTTVDSTSTGSGCGAAALCANTVTVLVPGLSVLAVASPASTTPGSRVTFTVTVTNVGQTPYAAAQADASLGGILDDAHLDGPAGATSGVAEVVGDAVTWTGALAVGQTATITFAAAVDDPDAGDRRLVSSVVSRTPGSSCPEGGTDPDCAMSVTVLVPQLTITTTADAATVTPGESIEYTILITNTGETPYLGAVVTDSLLGVLADAVYADDAAVTGGGLLDYTEPMLSWTGDLLIGASARVTFTVVVTDPDLGDKMLTNAVSSSAPGSSCPPGGTSTACSTVVRVLVPALTIEKSADRTSVAAGDTVHYTVTLSNTGETDYAPASITDPLAQVLDDASYNDDATATSGAVSYTAGVQTIAWVGALAQGSSVTIAYSVTTTFPALGDRALTNAVFSGSPGASCAEGTEQGCASRVAVLIPALTVTKTADTALVVAGGVVHYSIEATNTGETDYADADLLDAFSGMLDDAVYNGDATSSQGSLTADADSLQWSGALARGDTVVIGYSVTVELDGLDDAVLLNTVSSTSIGSTCPPGSTDAPCSVTVPIAARSISLSGLTSSFTLSGTPNSTVTSEGAVTMTVTTNSSSGYLVTVQGRTPALTSANPGNAASIPITELLVRASGTTPFVPVTLGPLTVADRHQATPPSGDAVSNDFRVDIPFVPGDTYSGTLDYIVSAQ